MIILILAVSLFKSGSYLQTQEEEELTADEVLQRLQVT